VLTTSSSLAFRSLLKRVGSVSGLAQAPARLTGLTHSALALHAALTAQDRALVLVVPTDADVEQVSSDARFFLSVLQGLSDAAAAQHVLPLPSPEVDPFRGLAPHLEVASARARALHALATGRARLVVASARALTLRLSDPELLAQAGFQLETGMDIGPDVLGERLATAGFTPEDPVDEHGESCIRGGIVDFFPAAEAQPVRVEFVGDTIESLRWFDAGTQRSQAALDRIVVSPQRELIDDDRSATVLDYVRRAGATLAVYELEDVEEKGRAQDSQWRRSAEDQEVRGWITGRPRTSAASERARTERGSGALASERVGGSAGAEPPGLEEDVEERGRAQDAQWRRRAEDREARGWITGVPRTSAASERARTERGWGAPASERVGGSAGAEPPGSHEDARGRQVAQFDDLVIAWDQVAAWLGTARRISQLQIEEDDAGGAHVSCLPAQEYHGRVPDWIDAIRAARERGDTVVFVAETPGRAERTIEIVAEYGLRAIDIGEADDLSSAAPVLVATGRLSRGFHVPSGGLHLFAETDLFEEERRVHERRRSVARAFLSDFRDLKVGDLVVHVDNGIGRFVGLKKLAAGPARQEQEFMELRYANDDKLFVSLERLDLIQKYTGGANPQLDKLGGTSWEKAKTRVKKAMRDMAEELLKLYAARKAVPGHAFSPDSHWHQEFADAFEYELTPDQKTAIADITRDMESPTPMDRLLCGDVGYGKTEVAMRAAFKAVIDSKQVAFLAPTTVLAFQHLRTLRERFAGFPVKIDMISRFRTPQEQKVILEQLAAGQIDVIVGTHRLLSKDVIFRDLGFLVVDEEQRFGVAHKERIKQMRKKVDVLTMTATPIPRTLNMSLAGIRDMSVIETPPRDRLAIQTQVVRFDEEILTRAMRTELERGGQVYFVHNRVESIFTMANVVSKMIPEARLAVAHGQMGEAELERVMVDFVAHKHDILLTTTIVENGLDISNANTIIINRADRYGLAQLYQLRGRVGRADRRAYAYLVIPTEQTLSPVARQRLAAIREFSDLGSGFRIAALDLEIRGAGNLLGGEQSGHIEAVGFDMYTKLLEQAIGELRGQPVDDDRRATVNLRIDLRIDEDYVPDMNQRLSIYRRMANARDEEEVGRLLDELADRYGPPPDSVLHLAEYARIRVLAERLGIESLDREGTSVVLKFRADAELDPALVLRMVQSRPDVSLLPPGVLKLDTGKSGAAGLRRSGSDVRSWWTARATARQVAPGFSKEAMLADEQSDAAADRRLLDQVHDVLAQLSQALIAS
jgi:transcription-repair coupling factor (superfamily II helicase)